MCSTGPLFSVGVENYRVQVDVTHTPGTFFWEIKWLVLLLGFGWYRSSPMNVVLVLCVSIQDVNESRSGYPGDCCWLLLSPATTIVVWREKITLSLAFSFRSYFRFICINKKGKWLWFELIIEKPGWSLSLSLVLSELRSFSNVISI